jgi:hypothetical protein
MFRIITYFILAFLISSLGTNAGTIDPKNNDQEYISLAEEQKFNCVGLLVSKLDNKITSASSCVVIQSNFALTAAHIFSSVPKEHTFYIILNDKAYLVEEVICHRSFQSRKLGFYDIALCKTAEAIDSIDFPELYKEKKELHKKVYICGYGLAGTFDTGSVLSDGKKRAGTNTVEEIKNHTLICSPTQSNNSRLEFLISHGDSGGGLFIDNKLAGINSYVYTKDGNANSSWRDKAGHTRVSLFLDWIRENTK